MDDERRLVERLLRHWRKVVAWGSGFPRFDEIDPWMVGEDQPRCLLVAVKLPVELSRFVWVGDKLLPELSGKAVALCPADTLVGVLLLHLPQVLSARRCLIAEGRATLGSVTVLYRGGLFPLSADGVAVDHMLVAAPYRLLRADEETPPPFSRTRWI